MANIPDNPTTPSQQSDNSHPDKAEGSNTNLTPTSPAPADNVSPNPNSTPTLTPAASLSSSTTPNATSTSHEKGTISPNAKHWKFNKTGNFYHDLAMRESGDVVNAQNRLGYIGLYQMDEAVLVDTKYYIKHARKGHKLYNNDWTGTWTGKNGIKSKADFMHNREKQLTAIREYHNIIWNKYLKDYQKYDGQVINGHKFTKSGMIAAAHLVGASSVKQLIDSAGKKVRADANHVTAYDYLDQFAGYTDIDFSDLN